MKRTMETVIELHSTLEESCFGFHMKGQAHTNLTQVNPGGPIPLNVISDLFFLEEKLFWMGDLLEYP